MNLYRNKQLPETFIDKFTNITCTDQLQTRHNDYNYLNIPAVKRSLEHFPFKCMIRTLNSLSIDVKSTADKLEFENILKKEILFKYVTDIQCDKFALFSCRQA